MVDPVWPQERQKAGTASAGMATIATSLCGHDERQTGETLGDSVC